MLTLLPRSISSCVPTASFPRSRPAFSAHAPHGCAQYIIGEIPSNLILKKVGSKWLSFLCMAFGAVTIGSAWVHNFQTFLGVRILLGIFEGGGASTFLSFRTCRVADPALARAVIPGIVYLLTRFYTRSELAFRIGVFLSLGPGLSGAFGGLAAAGFLNASVGSLRTWQKIFGEF